MIDPNTMNDLLANRAFRAFLAARTHGVDTDRPTQQQAALRVTRQIAKVTIRKPGSFRYNLAAATLLQFINEYLVEYGETMPPHLPEGHEQFSAS